MVLFWYLAIGAQDYAMLFLEGITNVLAQYPWGFSSVFA
jgi:hypothetical protein